MLLGAAFFWGLNPMVMKLGMRKLAPLPFNTLRLLIGALLILPILIIKKKMQPIKKRDVPLFLLVAVFGFFVFQFFYSLGVNATSASVSAIILGILPIVVALITWIGRLESLNSLKVAGIIASVVGVVMIALGDGGGAKLEQTYLWGVGLLVISEIGYGLYTVFLRPLTQRYSIYQIIFVVMCISLVLFATFTLPRYGTAVFSDLSLTTYLSALFSGFFALLLGNALWSAGIKRIGSTNASVYGNLTPVFGVLAGIIVLDEHLSLWQLVGAAVILLGVSLVNRRAR